MSVEGEWRQMTFVELLSGHRDEVPKDRESDESPPGTYGNGGSGTARLLEAVLERGNLINESKSTTGSAFRTSFLGSSA